MREMQITNNGVLVNFGGEWRKLRDSDQLTLEERIEYGRLVSLDMEDNIGTKTLRGPGYLLAEL